MTLLDDETAKRLLAERDLKVANALANPKVLEALNTLFEEGVQPSIAHSCMIHLRRAITQSN